MKFNLTQGQTALDLRKMKESLWWELGLPWAWRVPCQQGEQADQWQHPQAAPVSPDIYWPSGYKGCCFTAASQDLWKSLPLILTRYHTGKEILKKSSSNYILCILQLRMMKYLFTRSLKVRKKQGCLLPQINDSLAFRSMAINWVSQIKSEGNWWVWACWLEPSFLGWNWGALCWPLTSQ